MSDQFWHWNARLAGEDVGCEDGKPMPGFYRFGDRPVAIWLTNDGDLCARVGERMLDNHRAICELWGRCHAKPVAFDVYEAVAEHGEPWPDQSPAAIAAESVSPASDRETIAIDVRTLSSEAVKLIEAGAARDEDAAARAGHLADSLQKLRKRADEARAAEKRPHMDAAKAVDDAWRPAIDEATHSAGELKRRVIEPYLKVKAAAERRAREEAEREVREAEKRAASASTDTERQIAEAEAAAAARAAEAPIRSSTKGGRVSLRTFTTWVVSDPRAALRWLCERNEPVPDFIVDALQKLGKGLGEQGVAVPGIEKKTEQRAA